MNPTDEHAIELMQNGSLSSQATLDATRHIWPEARDMPDATLANILTEVRGQLACPPKPEPPKCRFGSYLVRQCVDMCLEIIVPNDLPRHQAILDDLAERRQEAVGNQEETVAALCIDYVMCEGLTSMAYEKVLGELGPDDPVSQTLRRQLERRKRLGMSARALANKLRAKAKTMAQKSAPRASSNPGTSKE